MSYWSIGEWRARIGSSWCALGRPFKMRSPFRGKTTQTALTLSQGVATLFLLIMSIGVNLGLRTLVARGHHLPLLNFSKGGTIPDRMYLINLGFVLTLILQITSALVYQLLSMAIRRSRAGVGGDLSESLSFKTCFVYYSIFLILKMINPSMHPVHWLILSVVQTVISLSVLWKALANKQDLVEKLHYVDTKVEVVMMTKLHGTWVLAVAKAVLDVALSVAFSVILSLLLISGDIEENPGPVGDIDFDAIDTTELNEGDMSKVIEEIQPIKSRYYSLGQSLNLEIADLQKIRDEHPSESDALKEVLLLWLNQNYDEKKHGPPTWRMLAEAVSKKNGGDNHELAKKIALNHPAVLTCDHNMKEVLRRTNPYRAKWRQIGVLLGIDVGTLNAIEANRRRVEDCLTDLIAHWLQKTVPKPTRGVLNAVLKYCKSADDYAEYLKCVYKIMTYGSFMHGDRWPPPITDNMRVCNLAMIKAEKVQRKHIQDEFVRMTITGKVDDILKKKVPVELKDIFTQIEEGKPRKVLLEGAPGCGKSTLSFHICQQWREGNLFQEYRLVILVRLREKAVHTAKDIPDLMPRRDKSHQVFEELTASRGKGILFVLDGWDELPPSVPGRSVIIQLLQSPSFDVIITSRPTSSMSLYELLILHTRIEILGFTKNELRRYFASCLDDDVTKIETLQQSIRKNPVVAGTCYLPLNASILVHLFKYFDDKLPETQFKIFDALVCNCILRHMKKSHKSEISGIKSIDDLPPVIKDQFAKICKIAYEGVMKDVIIFESEDWQLDSDFNTLGLLQGVESLIIAGTSHSYNFLHLSIQELLAAVHMDTQLEPSKQVKQFKQLFGRPRFAAVFQFYAAKTELKTPGIQKVVVKAVKKCLAHPEIIELTPEDTAQNRSVFKKLKDVVVAAVTKRSDNPPARHTQDYTTAQNPSVSKHVEPQPLILSLLHCLYEAQDSTLCQLVVQQFKGGLSLNGISLNPADCLAVGYFLTHCKQFEVDLGGCSVGDEGCKTLFREGAICDLQIL